MASYFLSSFFPLILLNFERNHTHRNFAYILHHLIGHTTCKRLVEHLYCAVCEKAVDPLHVSFHGVHVCLTCFFNETIPNPPSKTDPRFDQLNNVRTNAIEQRMQTILAEKK